MANVTITQLPSAGPITGQELVPVVQNGQTVQTTTAAISASPSQTQTFVTVNQEATLPNSRALSGGTGVGIVDNGAQSTLEVNLNGVSGSLESSGVGLIAKTGGTVTGRALTASGSGLTVTNGNGVSGNPTVALNGALAAMAGLGGTGLVSIIGGTTSSQVTITGTANQITVANGNGNGNPTLSITGNPVIPGIEGAVMPSGGTGDRSGTPTNGTLRYNTELAVFEGYANNNWGAIVTGSGVTSVGLSMPTEFSVANSPITSAGTLGVTWGSATANYVFAGPDASSGTPTFRALVNDDLPASGVSANTYGSSTLIPVITVNAKGVITGVTTSSIVGGLDYQGGWNASTNDPPLTSSTGTQGYYYVVTTAGNTDLDGITDWQIGDWAIFNGTIWQKIDQTNTVTSVNSQVGAVVLDYADVGAPATDGTNATGTWGIDITGNAGTATSATNVAGGGANQIVYNTASATTNFIAAPTGANTFLEWSGSAFQWSANPLGTVTSVDVSGGTTGLTTSGGPVTTSGTITLAGTLITSNGGTGLTSYTAGDIVYYATGTALSKLGIGSSTFILTSSGTAPQWSDPSGVTVGTATNATNADNVAVAATSTNATYYPTFVDATTGDNAIEVDTDLTYNPSTNTLTVPNLVATSGISGGTF